MTEPDPVHIAEALRVAAQSPCRSKRGVVLVEPVSRAALASGFNGPPDGCPGRAVCEGTCGRRSVHAEVRALREFLRLPWVCDPPSVDLVHVELGDDGGVVACDGPSCWQCSREILDVGFVGGVWLYERVPEEHCPHRPEEKRWDCTYCQGLACWGCWPGDDIGRRFGAPRPKPACDHDVLDRHRGMPVVEARWRRYTAAEFHRVTLERCGIR